MGSYLLNVAVGNVIFVRRKLPIFPFFLVRSKSWRICQLSILLHFENTKEWRNGILLPFLFSQNWFRMLLLLLAYKFNFPNTRIAKTMNSLPNKKRKVLLTCGSISYQDQIWQLTIHFSLRKKGYILSWSKREELRLLCLYVVKNP